MNSDVSTDNVAGMPPVSYLNQDDIGRMLGVPRTFVNVWRGKRYSTSGDPFPEPDSWLGIGKRRTPGWLPERMPEIEAWVIRHGLKAPALDARRTGKP